MRKASVAYYMGTPIITDEQYDELEERFGELLRVGHDIQEGLPHLYPLYSLKKYYVGETDSLDKIWNSTASQVITPKLDGAAISVLYINKEISQVLKRGDGEKGEDITFLFKGYNTCGVKQFLDIPELGHNILQVNGEIVAPKDIPNARNYAAGAINLKEVSKFKRRDVSFIAYSVQPYFTGKYSTDMEMLAEIGFKTVFTEDPEYLKRFPQDGTVIRVDKNSRYDGAGYTSKHPRGAYALKERTEGVRTKLLDVIWQVGGSGKVTPVAVLEPVLVGDATVSRATLNNPGFIESLNLEIGDDVMVERSGGIIPRIIKKAESTE